MLIQVVHCHPLTESFDHALYLAIVETLRAGGHQGVATVPIAKDSSRR
jgi:hypothetical protein